MRKILNFGSLNIDYVYSVDHFVKPGETMPSKSLEIFSGGKGANQSVALARAAANVYHAGKIGHDGKGMKEGLQKDGVKTEFIFESDSNNGHAIIQVDSKGENAIILHPGANKEIKDSEIENVLSHFSEGDFLLLQNEINSVDVLIRKGYEKGMKVCFNPAPMTLEVHNYPLELVEMLIVNEIEGSALLKKEYSEETLDFLSQRFPKAEIIMTIGSKGADYAYQDVRIHVDAAQVNPVDTTAAGDTFIGYYLAAKIQNKPVKECLDIATKASGICITQPGAQISIPKKESVF